MTTTQAFNKAYEMLKAGVKCSLGKDANGGWYCVERVV